MNHMVPEICTLVFSNYNPTITFGAKSVEYLFIYVKFHFDKVIPVYFHILSSLLNITKELIVVTRVNTITNRNMIINSFEIYYPLPVLKHTVSSILF